MIINKQESEALNITRFVMSIFIVFFHAYTSVQIYDYWKDLPVYRGVARFFSLQIGEMGVPVFFLISGYLFFGKYQQTWMCYKSKMQKRFYSLFVPYIFWNAFIIAAYYVAESIPTIQTLFNEGGKLVHDFDLHDFLFAFWSHKGGNPILTQMWFVRDLLLLVICAPIIYLLARYAKFVAIFCFGLIWFVKWEVPNWESGLLFFFIGACFSIYGKSITEEVRKIAPFLFILTPLLLLADFLLSGTTTGFYVHRTLIFVGVFFIIALVTVLIEKKKMHDIVFLTSGSFFLYIIHDPMIRFVRKFTLRWIDHTSEFQAIAIYFAAVAIDVAVAYFVFWCLRKCAPGFLKWSTGGR